MNLYHIFNLTLVSSGIVALFFIFCCLLILLPNNPLMNKVRCALGITEGKQQRDKLLETLRSSDLPHGLNARVLHIEAEDLLLAFLDDKKVTEAWQNASKNWQY